MKNFINAVKEKAIKGIIRAQAILADQRGEGFVDTAIKILISVVIGALLLAGLYTLFGETVLPELQRRISDMFSYKG